MSVVGDAMATVRRIILLDEKVSGMDVRLSELTRLHADTRERVMRIEGFIAAARMPRLPRRED